MKFHQSHLKGKINTNMYLIFDSNQLCYSSFYSMGNLSNKEKKTGIIYGFLNQVYITTQLFKKQKPILIFAWDSKLSYRRNFYKNYKRKRREKKKTEGPTASDYAQFDLLRKEILPSIGFKNVFMQTGFEADDIIAYICNKYNLERKIIVSSDEDLYQLLDIQTSMYKTKAKRLYTNDNWFDEWGEGSLVTADWNKVKALAGCSTDEVAGIKCIASKGKKATGVGEKTAIKYLAGKLKETTKTYQAIVSKKGQMKYNRNLPLVTIPYPYETMEDIVIKKNKLSFDDFYAVCLEYNFKSIISDIKLWRKTLKLK